jgi:succinyl-diaminopimelate desuccinylase
MPDKGINAFEGAALIVQSLQALKTVFARRSFRPLGAKAMKPTLNLGGVFGVGPGPKVNTVPAQAWFTIDRRILPNEKLKDAERELRAALKAAAAKVPKVKMEVEVFQRIDPCTSGPNSSFHDQYAQAVRAGRGPKPKWSIGQGFTDQHWYAHDLGLPSVGYGPEGEGAHGVNEKAKLAELISTAKIYATFMERFDGEGA